MLKNCSNCGGKLYFSPKDKGNVCENCASIFPIDYEYKFVKKPFEENVPLDNDELLESLQNVKCSSCGANIMLNKFQMQSNCPYCGNSTIVKGKKKNLMYIDSIVPFAFSKTEALQKFKKILQKKFYANKKLFKNVTETDIVGAYVNTFIFDFNTSSQYYGVFSYTCTKTDKNGKSTTETCYKNVSGIYDRNFVDLSVEANSNLEQHELFSILPFDYTGAVVFKEDFMHNHILEYQDKMFNDCFKEAERISKKQIENDLLRKYNCDRIERLTLNTAYTDKRYNYCLLPVYFINRVVNEKRYKVLMNGQTGKVGKLPTSVLRVMLTILIAVIGVVGVILLCLFFT